MADSSLIFDQVEKHFRYFIDERGFSIVSKKLYDSFDNATIILQSEEFRILIVRERGFVNVAIAPLSSPIAWYGLGTLVPYLTRETEQLDLNNEASAYADYDAGIEWIVERLASALRKYYPQIRELFRNETFAEKRADLEAFKRSGFEKWLKSYRSF
jgi:hypothetical protein